RGKVFKMNYDLLNQLGMASIDFSYIILGMMFFIIVLMILTIVLICSNRKLKKKYEKFMLGKNAATLEESIFELNENSKYLKEAVQDNKKNIRDLYKKHEKAFQKVGIIKYDAYQQMGGLLSFTIALLDENNDGFILNSVHSSDGCYSYTKEIRKGNCDIVLGNEEKIALEKAMSEEE
ncbi:MAG: DUF4446 family protein, partial [Lachnospiraceae bacterium]